MLLREPQHVTAIGNVTHYAAHKKTLFFSSILIWVHPPSRVLQRCWPRAPAEFRSVVVVLWGTRFPREDTIDNIDSKKCALHVYLQDGARRVQIQQEDRFDDQFSVQIQSVNRHTYVATRLLRGEESWCSAGYQHKQDKIRESMTGYTTINSHNYHTHANL